MTREELFKLHEDICLQARELMKKKNHDYSKSDPFGNFRMCEARQTCSSVEGIVNRIDDKLNRLVSVCAKGAQVKDESIQDTIIDVINYSILALGVLKDKQDKEASRLKDLASK